MNEYNRSARSQKQKLIKKLILDNDNDRITLVHGWYESLSENRTLLFYRGILIYAVAKNPNEPNNRLTMAFDPTQVDKELKNISLKIFSELDKGDLILKAYKDYDGVLSALKVISENSEEHSQLHKHFSLPVIQKINKNSISVIDQMIMNRNPFNFDKKLERRLKL